MLTDSCGNKFELVNLIFRSGETMTVPEFEEYVKTHFGSPPRMYRMRLRTLATGEEFEAWASWRAISEREGDRFYVTTGSGSPVHEFVLTGFHYPGTWYYKS